MSELNIRIDWSELDLYGHVNNVMIFKYVQAARIRYCESIGLGTLNEAGKTGFILAAANCQYKKKILYPGDLRIESHVEWIRNTSFQLRHRIYDADNEIAVESSDVIVLYDYEQDGKIPVTAEIKRAIEQHESRSFDHPEDGKKPEYWDIE